MRPDILTLAIRLITLLRPLAAKIRKHDRALHDQLKSLSSPCPVLSRKQSAVNFASKRRGYRMGSSEHGAGLEKAESDALVEAEGVASLEAELSSLREEVSQLERGSPGYRYPPLIRRRLAQMASRLRSLGWQAKSVEDALTVRWSTLRPWLKSSPEPPQSLVPVQVLSPVSEVLEPEVRSVHVVTPSGYRIEGLSLPEALQLLQALS